MRNDAQMENIIVMVRVKPLNEGEISDKSFLVVDNNSISVDIKTESKSFCFDYVASDKISQEIIFEKAGRTFADACLEGYNATVFAYGQTGAGKTYTIQGPSSEQIPDEKLRHKSRGLMPRVFEYIFETMKRSQEENSNTQYNIKYSYLEIYNEIIIDLLDPQSENLNIREDIKKGVYVENLIEESAESIDDLTEALKRGKVNRHVGATAINKESSRSHSVFTLTIESRTKLDGIVNKLSSRFHIIDLAGSERQKLTDAVGERLKEAGMINKSLSALGNVINSLVDISQGKSRHVHYRDSKLTFLLKDSLGGNSKTAIIANVSQNSISIAETLSTLNFARRAKLIKNKAVVNEDTTGTVLLLQQEVKKLKIEIAELKSTTPQTQSMCSNKENTQLESLLQNTIDLRVGDVKIHEQISKEKDKEIEMLRKCIKRCQHNKSKDKMILKLKEAALEKIQEGKLSNNEEIQILKKEIQLLREDEDKALSNVMKVFNQTDMRDTLIKKNNEQNEYISQMNDYIKNLTEEYKVLISKDNKETPEESIEEIITKIKLEYGEKLEDISQKYLEYFL